MIKKFFLKVQFHLPMRIFFQLIKNGIINVFKDQVKSFLSAKNFNQIDQILML